jgi:hypothetical protein
MWLPGAVEFRARELDFSSAGLGRHPTTAVLADGMEIVNALDLVDLTEEPVQIVVCEDCGTSGCAPGGRVDFRTFHDGLVIMPAFNAMEHDSWARTEYRPPSFMRDRGIPWITGRALATLRDRVPGLADLLRWPGLSLRECALILQWEAPAACLGSFPEQPRTQTRALIPAEDADSLEFARALDRLLARAIATARPAMLVEAEPVSVYLDLPGTPRWSPMGTHEGQRALSPVPGFGVVESDSA